MAVGKNKRMSKGKKVQNETFILMKEEGCESVYVCTCVCACLCVCVFLIWEREGERRREGRGQWVSICVCAFVSNKHVIYGCLCCTCGRVCTFVCVCVCVYILQKSGLQEESR